MFENVLKKGKIGTMELRNRFVVPAMGTGRSGLDGFCTDNVIAYYTERSKGGFGLITVEVVGVDPLGRAIPEQIMLDDDKYIPRLQELTDSVHKYGAKIVPQLHHAGRETLEVIVGGQPVAPSAIPCPLMRSPVRELTLDEVQSLVEKFINAAVRAKKAGFDGVELHAAHGYLIGQFLSGYSNKRTDNYGGTFLRRTNFLMEIIRGVKEKCSKSFPVIVRLSGDERTSGGLTPHETAAIAALAEKNGADAIHVSTGCYATMEWIIAPNAVSPGFNLNDTRIVKQAVNIPVIAVGRINEPLLADSVIADGIADFVSLGRGSLADPYFPLKVKEGRINEILSCVACNTRCLGVVAGNTGDRGVSCMVNPFCGREDTMVISPAPVQKTVVVVGGGPGGLEAAWVSAARGHKVILFEKSDRLGGQFIPASVPPGKQALLTSIVYYGEMCKKYGVDVRLNTEATEKEIISLNPDAVILATGATPMECGIPAKDTPVVDAIDVLDGKVMLGNNVLIVGGGMVGIETAEHALSQGRTPTIVEMQDEVAKDMPAATKTFALKKLKEHDVKIITRTKVSEITGEGAVCVNLNGVVDLKGYDMVIMAIGAVSYNPLEAKLKGKVKALHVIGDALKPRKAVEAIDEGAKLALSI